MLDMYLYQMTQQTLLLPILNNINGAIKAKLKMEWY